MQLSWPTAKPPSPQRHDDVQRLFERSTELAGDVAPAGVPEDQSGLGEGPRLDRRGALRSTPFDLVHEEDRERTAEVASEVRKPGAEVTDFENRLRHKEGGWVWLSGAPAATGSGGTAWQRT